MGFSIKEKENQMNKSIIALFVILMMTISVRSNMAQAKRKQPDSRTPAGRNQTGRILQTPDRSIKIPGNQSARNWPRQNDVRILLARENKSYQRYADLSTQVNELREKIDQEMKNFRMSRSMVMDEKRAKPLVMNQNKKFREDLAMDVNVHDRVRFPTET